MLGRNVERGEIVEVGLDVRAFGDGETHIGEDLGDLVGDLAHRMDAALGKRTLAHREGDVGTLSREPHAQRSAAKRLALSFQRLADAILKLVDGLAETLALFRRHAPERLHQLRDAALLAERGDAHLFERAEVCRLGYCAKQLALDPLERSSLSRGRLGHGGLKLQALAAADAASARLWKVAGSCTAISASTLRSSSMPALFRPSMNRP